MIETDVMEELDKIEDIVPGTNGKTNKDWNKKNDWNTKKEWNNRDNWNKEGNWDEKKDGNGSNWKDNSNWNSNDNKKVQEIRRMDDSNVSRVVIDKNGNKVVRKKLFSVSVGTLFLIAVAAIAIYATTQVVAKNSAVASEDEYKYSSKNDYSYFLEY